MAHRRRRPHRATTSPPPSRRSGPSGSATSSTGSTRTTSAAASLTPERARGIGVRSYISVKKFFVFTGDDSDSDDDEDPALRAAAVESMRTLQQDEERRRGAGSSGSGAGASHAFPTSASVSLRRSDSQAAGGAGPVGSMDHFVHRRCSAKQPTMKQAFRGVKKTAEVARNAVKHIFKWFIHAGIPVHAASSPYFQSMIDAVGETGPGLKAPTPREIYGVGLQGEVAELQQWVNTFKLLWKERGCTLMCDGWTGTTRKSMINFLVYCSEGTIFLKSIDASDHAKTANYLCGLMDDMVERIGEENVVHILTDNEASYKAAGKKLMDRRRHLYWVPCAAHCLDLMMEDIGKDKFVVDLVVQAQKITTFIYGHNMILNMMRANVTNGRDLIRVGSTRFVSNFISLESLQRHMHELIAFFNSAEYLEYVERGLRDESATTAGAVSRIVGDLRFWEKVAYYLKLVEPLVQVLRLVDGDDKNDMGFLYEALDHAKEMIMRKMPRAYKKWWAIIDKRWEMILHHPLHVAGYFLNPRFQYSESVHNDAEVIQGTIDVIRRLSRSAADRVEAEREIEFYTLRTRTYGDPDMQFAVMRLSPAEWWIQINNMDHGLNPLAYIAIRVLSQTTAASQCERNWSTFSLIHTKVKNRLKAERLENLVFCHSNMKLRIKNIRLRQKLQEKGYLQNLGREDSAADPVGQIDVDELFEDEHPLQSCVEIRREVDEAVFDHDDKEWAEGELDGVEARDPELKSSSKRLKEEGASGDSSDFEPHRHSDSLPPTPRLATGLPRSYSQIERVVREDPAIEKMKRIYSRTGDSPRPKSMLSQLDEEEQRRRKGKGTSSSQRSKAHGKKKHVIHSDSDTQASSDDD